MNLLKFFKKSKEQYIDTPSPTPLPHAPIYKKSGNDVWLNPDTLIPFVKKLFPYIVDVSTVCATLEKEIYHGEIHSKKCKSIRVYLILKPTHFSETFMDTTLEKLLKDKLDGKLSPLIKCMYPDYRTENINYIFSPEKTSTLLKEIKFN